MKVSSTDAVTVRLDANFTNLKMSPLGEEKRSVDLDDGKRRCCGKSAGGMSKTRRGARCTQSANFPKNDLLRFSFPCTPHGSVENL